LGIINRVIGGGRTRTSSYSLVSLKTVHGAAPFLETVHDEAPFGVETVHRGGEKGATDGGKPCTAVHPNSDNKKNTESRLNEDFERWYSAYPRRRAPRAALMAYKQARSRGATAEMLLDGATRYAAQRSSQDQQFTKYPATWLNGDCWLDEPEIQSADVPPVPSSNTEALSMSERIAAAAKRARVQSPAVGDR
jgi:hypothetical protein